MVPLLCNTKSPALSRPDFGTPASMRLSPLDTVPLRPKRRVLRRAIVSRMDRIRRSRVASRVSPLLPEFFGQIDARAQRHGATTLRQKGLPSHWDRRRPALMRQIAHRERQ